MRASKLSSCALAVDRRGFLVGVSTLAASSMLPACRNDDVELDAAERFYLLSQLLTGFDDLDEGLAELYRSSIDADADQAAALERLYAAGGFDDRPPADLDELGGALELEADIADRITMMWYSGIHVLADGESQVATHLDALCWRALNTNAPSQCGGGLGSWSAGV